MDNRKYYIDILKIMSAIFVIAIHLTSIKWFVIDVKTFDWQVLNIVNSFTRVCVPLFVMASGVFMLDQKRTMNFSIIIKKYILRIVIVYIVWSMVYAIFSLLINPMDYGLVDLVKQFIYRTIKGPIHFWYLVTLIGLYIITPFIREFTKEKRLIEWFLGIAFFFMILRSLREIILIDTIELYIEYINFYFTLGYIIYFVLGYYLSTYPLSKKIRSIAYGLAIVAFLFTVIMTTVYTYDSNLAYEGFYGYLRPTILLISVGFFVYIQNLVSSKKLTEKVKQIIIKLSNLNFGVYLIHLMLVYIVGELALLDLNIPIFISLFVYTIIIYSISLTITWILSKIKLLKFIL